jgi:hypothetical protein
MYYYTNSLRRQNFLEENGIFPVREEDGTAYYEKTKELSRLLEKFDIIRYVFGGHY